MFIHPSVLGLFSAFVTSKQQPRSFPSEVCGEAEGVRMSCCELEHGCESSPTTPSKGLGNRKFFEALSVWSYCTLGHVLPHAYPKSPALYGWTETVQILVKMSKVLWGHLASLQSLTFTVGDGRGPGRRRTLHLFLLDITGLMQGSFT